MAIVPTITTMKCSNIQMNPECYTFEPIRCSGNTKNIGHASAFIDTLTSAPGWASVTVYVTYKNMGGVVTTFVILETMGREVYDVVGEKIYLKVESPLNWTLLFDSLAQKGALMRERRGKDENLGSKI